MVRQNQRLLLVGLLLFLGGTGAALTLTGGESPLKLLAMAVLFAGALACFGLVTWRALFRVDWERVEAEQRLWESGPVGRAWLRVRQRLSRI